MKGGTAVNFKNTFTYAFLVAMSVWLAVFINGKGGVMLLVCLVTSLVLSVVNFILVRKKINFDIRFDNTTLRKGDDFSLTLIVSKSTFVPTPYVEIKLRSSEKLSAEKSEIIKTAMFISKNPLEAEIVYKALYSGFAEVEIEYVRLTDYLGILKRNVYCAKEDDRKCASLRIIPEIPESVTLSDLLKTASEANAYDDNDEDSEETVRYGSGTPGYEHRPYVPGDPIKKINWKLSSKRDNYLLRLDEKIAVTSQLMILDAVTDTATAEAFKTNDILVEGTLGMLSQMLRRELECDFYVFNRKVWECYKVSDEKSLNELQLVLSGYNDLIPHKNRIPPELKEKGTPSVAIIFTNNPNELLSEAEKTPEINCLSVTTKENLRNNKTDKLWIIDELYEIRRA